MRNFHAGLVFVGEDKAGSFLGELKRLFGTHIKAVICLFCELVIVICVQEYVVATLAGTEHLGEGEVEEFLVAVVGDKVDVAVDGKCLVDADYLDVLELFNQNCPKSFKCRDF